MPHYETNEEALPELEKLAVVGELEELQAANVDH